MLVIVEKSAIGQNSAIDIKKKFIEAISQYKKGDFEKSELILINLSKNLNQTDTLERIAINNLLGIISKKFGNYTSGIQFYTKNLNLLNADIPGNTQKIAKTYNNLGNIFRIQGQYSKAVHYYIQSIKLINSSQLSVKQKAIQTEYIYSNLAIVYTDIKEYSLAISYFEKSLSIKKTYHLKEIEKVWFNLAITYEKTGKLKLAELYFDKAISFQQNNTESLARIYKFYGNFLLKQKRFPQAKLYLLKAKTFYEQNFGFRHPYTANAYVYFGNYFSAVSKPDSALYWYQKSLIADTKLFHSENINENPSFDDSFSKLQLLKGLKMKAQALYNSAQKEDKAIWLKLSIRTCDTALNLITKIRDEYVSVDNKLVITEIEKECYSTAVEASFQLYQKTKNINDIYKTWFYVYSSKASLLNHVTEVEKEINDRISDSERISKTELEHKIAGYKKLIFEENESPKPDSLQIQFLQSKLFDLTTIYDTIIKNLKNKYSINETSKKTHLYLKHVQKRLPKNTALIEYFITQHKNSEEQDLYTFIINKNSIQYFKKTLSDRFFNNIKIFKNRMNNSNETYTIDSYNNFNKRCYELYLDLFKQADQCIKDKNIIIVPDEEIAFLSFDALLSSFKTHKFINYSDLDYLIYKHSFSYAYSTLMFMNQKKENYSNFVYAFAPVYKDTLMNVLRQKFGKLEHTKAEINSVLKRFKGKAYIGEEALEDNFIMVSDKGGIIHIAGHASHEDNQKEFSFLAFSDKQKKSTDDGLLYAYEIEKLHIRSPMIVLSACNTGRGRLYSGEGVYSLSRSFLTAGASSVVYSLWNVNDDSGSEIMTDFYTYLSEGENKNTALRHAKLNYLKTASPMMSDPVYWSGYVLTGKIQALKTNKLLYFSVIGIGLVLVVLLFYFLKKKK